MTEEEIVKLVLAKMDEAFEEQAGQLEISSAMRFTCRNWFCRGYVARYLAELEEEK